MKNTLNWVNRNTDEDGTNVYRSDAPITSVEGMTPVAVLPKGASSWEDTDVVQGQYYHYCLEIFKGEQKFLGINTPVLTQVSTGPGPQTILRGDWERGFFGEVTPDEFVDHSEIVLLSGLSTIGATVSGSISWIKCARKGKVLMYPKTPIRVTVSWQQLYDKGLVFGRDDGGPTVGALGSVNQNTIIEVKGFRYRVRLMKALSDGVDQANTGTGTDSEWHDIVLSLLTTIPAEQTWGNLANYTEAQLGVSASPRWMQELNIAGNTAFWRNASLALVAANIGSVSTSYQWQPVLELVD
jgi:hypothetical protein